MTDTQFHQALSALKSTTPHGTRRLVDYEHAKSRLQFLALTPEQYQRAARELAAWVKI